MSEIYTKSRGKDNDIFIPECKKVFEKIAKNSKYLWIINLNIFDHLRSRLS